MWISLNLDLAALFLPLAVAAAAAVYGLTALARLFVAMVAKHPGRPLRVAAWSGGLAASCVLLVAPMLLIDLPWPDDDLVHALLWVWLVVFLAGVGLIVWQGWHGSWGGGAVPEKHGRRPGWQR